MFFKNSDIASTSYSVFKKILQDPKQSYKAHIVFLYNRVYIFISNQNPHLILDLENPMPVNLFTN